jgi:hypothetical protein
MLLLFGAGFLPDQPVAHPWQPGVRSELSTFSSRTAIRVTPSIGWPNRFSRFSSILLSSVRHAASD